MICPRCEKEFKKVNVSGIELDICDSRAYQASRAAGLRRRNAAPIRIIDQPYDHSRSHGCFPPSRRLTSSRLKNFQWTVRPS